MMFIEFISIISGAVALVGVLLFPIATYIESIPLAFFSISILVFGSASFIISAYMITHGIEK